MARRPGGGLSLALGLALLGALWLTAPTVDSDYFWHLRLGRWIAENGWTLPRTEVFSHTAAGVPIVVQGWLFDLVQYLIDRTFGASGIRGMVSVLFVGTWAAVHAAVRMSPLPEPRAILVTGVCMVAAAGFIAPRPLLASNLGFALVLLALLRFRATGKRAWLALPPPVFAVWGNLHFAYPAGLALIGIFCVASTLERLAPLQGRPVERGVLTVPLALTVGALSIGALCLNPYGPGILLETMSMAGMNAGSGLVEWASPDFHGLRGRLFLLPLAVLAASWALCARRAGWLDILLVLPFAGAALVSQRHIPLACMAMAPVIARALSGSQESSPAPATARTTSRGRGLVAGAATALLAGTVVAMLLPAAAERDRRIVERDYPVAAVEFIRTRHLEGPLINSYAMGGFLVDRLSDRVPVFIDGRFLPFAGEVARDHGTIVSLQPGWERLLDRYGIRLALLGPEDSALAAAMAGSGRWRKVQDEGGFALLVAEDGSRTTTSGSTGTGAPRDESTPQPRFDAPPSGGGQRGNSENSTVSR